MSDAAALREGTAQDVAEMMVVMVDAFPPAFGEAWTRDQCLGILGLPRVWMTLARVGDEPAGFALSRIVVDEAELLLLGVRPLFRRRGIGSALIDRTRTIARAGGANRLHLEVREGNDAMRLYSRAGFGEVGRRRGYYRGTDGQLYDALSLASPLGYDHVVTIRP